jgi:hypothetical protein
LKVPTYGAGTHSRASDSRGGLPIRSSRPWLTLAGSDPGHSDGRIVSLQWYDYATTATTHVEQATVLMGRMADYTVLGNEPLRADTSAYGSYEHVHSRQAALRYVPYYAVPMNE